MTDLTTRLVHHAYQPPEGFQAVPPPVHKASTVIFPNVAALRSRQWKRRDTYTYGLHGTPTTLILEERIATLEGAQHCVLVPSGLAAISLVGMAVLTSGDEVLIPDNAYGWNKAFAEAQLKAWGVHVVYYDPMNPQDLAARLTPRSRLVWLEAAGSITLEFPDLPALLRVLRSYGSAHRQGLVAALDNTWGAGIAFRPFELGIDISVHALTKYPSGGADVLMGAVLTCDPQMHDRLMDTHARVGFGVGANDVELVLRGLPSMGLRYAAHDAATRELALWMQSQPQVERVLHPALPGSPGFEAWRRDCTAAACLFSVVFKPHFSPDQIDGFCDALRLFKLGYSWAGPISLCAPYDVSKLRTLDGPHPRALVRFSVGLESVSDLRQDLAQALARL